MFTKRVSGNPSATLTIRDKKKQKTVVLGLGSVGGLIRRLDEVTQKILASKYAFFFLFGKILKSLYHIYSFQ